MYFSLKHYQRFNWMSKYQGHPVAESSSFMFWGWKWRRSKIMGKTRDPPTVRSGQSMDLSMLRGRYVNVATGLPTYSDIAGTTEKCHCKRGDLQFP